MGQKPSYEKLLEKIDSLEKAVTRHRRREAVLWKNQERLTQIIESIPIPTFVIDNNHVVTHYNSAMENLTGIAVDEVVKLQLTAHFGNNRVGVWIPVCDNLTRLDLIFITYGNSCTVRYLVTLLLTFRIGRAL